MGRARFLGENGYCFVSVFFGCRASLMAVFILCLLVRLGCVV